MASLDTTRVTNDPSEKMKAVNAIEIGVSVIRQEAEGLRQLAEGIDGAFARAVELLLSTPRRVILSGMGKSGHIARKVAATLAATGTPAFFVHPAEAMHGDLGMLVTGDTLLAFSNSGATRELSDIVSHSRLLGVPVIGVASRAESFLALQSDVYLPLPKVAEACPVKIAPTTSTTMMLALGDALAIATMKLRGSTQDDLARLHPGGNIGRALLPVERLIPPEAMLPLVRPQMRMRDVVLEMTSVGKGVAGVVDDAGDLIGIITDGDVRRNFDRVSVATAGEIMSIDPVILQSGTLVRDAYRLLNEAKITVAFVTARREQRRPIGVIHLHDLAAAA